MQFKVALSETDYYIIVYTKCNLIIKTPTPIIMKPITKASQLQDIAYSIAGMQDRVEAFCWYADLLAEVIRKAKESGKPIPDFHNALLYQHSEALRDWLDVVKNDCGLLAD